jgi:hypothetical protein
MRKWVIAALTVFLSLGAFARAEIVEVARYWPGDGIWIHYSTESPTGPYEIGIWVYCGFGCTEFSSLYPIPPFEQWVQSPVSHNHYIDRPAWYAQIEHSTGETLYGGNAKAVWDCDDLRSDLNQEYVDTYSGGSVYFASGYLPNCEQWDGGWKQSGGSANFMWPELNDNWTGGGNPHEPWGIVTAGLLTGLEATRTNYNRGGILLSGAFRCPHGNAAVGGVFNSMHVHGRAADMYSADHGGRNWDEAEFNLLRNAAMSTTPAPVESLLWTTYADHHYHAAW